MSFTPYSKTGHRSIVRHRMLQLHLALSPRELSAPGATISATPRFLSAALNSEFISTSCHLHSSPCTTQHPVLATRRVQKSSQFRQEHFIMTRTALILSLTS